MIVDYYLQYVSRENASLDFDECCKNVEPSLKEIKNLLHVLPEHKPRALSALERLVREHQETYSILQNGWLRSYGMVHMRYLYIGWRRRQYHLANERSYIVGRARYMREYQWCYGTCHEATMSTDVVIRAGNKYTFMKRLLYEVVGDRPVDLKSWLETSEHLIWLNHTEERRKVLVEDPLPDLGFATILDPLVAANPYEGVEDLFREA